jgi:putative spermidine/putrescine transport system permease protein
MNHDEPTLRITRLFTDRRLLAIPMLLMIAIFLYGFVRIGFESFTPKGEFTLALYTEFLSEPVYVRVLVRTIWVAVVTTCLCLLLGYPVAMLLARSRHRDLLLIMLISPWLVSVVVRTFGWMILLGNRGVINLALKDLGMIDTPIKMMFNATGVIIGLVHVLVPLMVICVLSVLIQAEKQLEEAATSLGASPVQTFARVIWPLSLPGVYLGASLTLLTSTGAIVTPLLLGGLRDGMLGTQIYQEIFSMFNFPRAAALAIILLVISFLLVLPLLAHESRMRRKRGL